MVQFDATTGALLLPLWVTATVAAVLVVLGVLALVRTGALKTLFALVVVGLAGYGGWMGWTLVHRVEANDRIEELRTFDRRAGELLARATVPDSPLSCLDGMAGDQVEAACEKILFGTPESISAAVSFVAARLALLATGTEQASRSDLNYDATLGALRHGLQSDRYGIVAHVMLLQESCQPTQCDTLALLKDPNRVRVNLQERPFDALVDRYAPSWTAPRGAPVAEGRPPGGAPVSSKYDFPSAASIPPVSIMNAEPPAPTTTASTPAPAAAATPAMPPAAGSATPTPPRRPPAARAPVARAPEAAAPPPVQLTPMQPPPSASSPPGAQQR